MTAIQDLEENIDSLTEIIIKLNEKTPAFDIGKYFLTPRQMTKKLLKSTSFTGTDMTGASMPSDDKSIHIIVYGKYLEDADGKVIDDEIKFPECVDKQKAMPENHPTIKDKIPKMKKDIKNSIRVLNIKKTELADAFKLAGQQITTGIASVASAIVVLPIGAGAPMGIAAAQSIVSAINTLSSRVMEIIPILGPLIDIPLMIAEVVITIVLGLVNTILQALIVVIGTIQQLKTLVMPVVKLIGG